jgi:hypothetical protein
MTRNRLTRTDGRTVEAYDLDFNNAFVLRFTGAVGPRMAQDAGGFAPSIYNAGIS